MRVPQRFSGTHAQSHTTRHARQAAFQVERTQARTRKKVGRAPWLVGVGLLVGLFVGCSGGGGTDGGAPAPGGQAALPPDPGPAGLATLAGIDSNNNGVRDDVERYIALTYPSSTEADTRAGLTQYTKAVQAALKDAVDPNASVAHMKEEILALQCLMGRRPDDYNPVFVKVRAEILNTMDRSRAYLMKETHVTNLKPQIPTLPTNQRLSACK